MKCLTCGRELPIGSAWVKHPDNTRTCADRACWPVYVPEWREPPADPYTPYTRPVPPNPRGPRKPGNPMHKGWR